MEVYAVPAAGPWMSTAKLRSLFAAGLTYDEIAEANERSEGWRPTRAGVARKFERLGFPPRNASHADLIPWRIRPEHRKDRIGYMLQAESRKRQGLPLSESDLTLVSLLHDLLFGRGRFLVVGYDPKIGFYLADRSDEDEDIIRSPKARESADREPEIDQESAVV
jgi:hypothetical protein